MLVVWWYKVIIVSALSLSLRDKDRLRDRESLKIIDEWKSALQWLAKIINEEYISAKKITENTSTRVSLQEPRIDFYFITLFRYENIKLKTYDLV